MSKESLFVLKKFFSSLITLTDPFLIPHLRPFKLALGRGLSLALTILSLQKFTFFRFVEYLFRISVTQMKINNMTVQKIYKQYIHSNTVFPKGKKSINTYKAKINK